MKLKARGDLNGFLDAGSHIRGELHFDDTFRVDGRLTGKAVSTGNLVVGENGVVDADVEVGSIFVSGTLRGSVTARTRIEIAAGAKVFADLTTPTLVVEDGAILEGRCSMSSTRSSAEPKGPRPEAVVARLPISKDSA
ncbi:MAG: polymer-forming cytoskeletal protein [Acidobacteriota bacterium]|nr:polymer-forming cytoskeletal protein [Acidobacteriota bacterium]